MLLVLALFLLAAAPAAASTASVQGGTLTITGSDTERNVITVVPSGGVVEIRDTGAALAAGSGCTASGGVVRCPLEGLREVVAELGDNNDGFAAARALTLPGRIRGGSGNDVLSGGGGPDELDGGAGADTANYVFRVQAVSVTVGRDADDGEAGERDNVVGVERVVGGGGPDTLVGGDGRERLEGRGGDDRIDGGGGNDTVIAGAGADVAGGGAGHDRLDGGFRSDLLDGGTGNDTFVVAGVADGSDALRGGPGFDRADYAARRRGVVVDADGRDDDGERSGGSLSATGPLPALGALPSPERDNVLTDVEHILGGAGDDVLGAAPTGGRLAGRGGTDVLFGGPGRDQLFGEAGFDRLATRDGRRDELSCGTQTDRVFVDSADARSADCEATSRSFGVVLAPLARSLDDDGRLRVRVTCPAQAGVRCVGAVRAATVRRVRRPGGARRTLRLGAVRFNAPTGGSVEVRLRVGSGARRVLARLRTTRVRLSARGRDAAGAARPVAARLVLRR